MTTSANDKPRRKRGGQPGNNNALKHGFYSHSFTRLENERLDTGIKGELDDEEALLNVLIDRTFESTNMQEMSHDNYLMTLRAVALAVGRIESIHRSRKAIYETETSIEKALEELKYIPLEED